MPYVAQYQLCLNEAKDKIVPCDSPEARSNLALPGVELSDEVARKYGLTDQPKEEAEVVEKAVSAAPSNKARSGAASK